MLNTYGPHLACILALQYLQLKERRKTEVKTEKQPASSESSQIGIIGMWRKKCRFTNSNLGMQKGPRKGLLKILKGHRNLQESASKVGRNNLKNFKNNSESPRSLSESFEDASEREIEPKAFSGDLNEDQLETE